MSHRPRRGGETSGQYTGEVPEPDGSHTHPGSVPSGSGSCLPITCLFGAFVPGAARAPDPSAATAISSFMSAPMYSFPPLITARLAAFGSSCSTPDLTTMCRATQVRTAWTHECVHMHLQRSIDAQSSDVALLDWRQPEFSTDAGIFVLRRSLSAATALPQAIREHRHLQRSGYAHFLNIHDDHPILGAFAGDCFASRRTRRRTMQR